MTCDRKIYKISVTAEILEVFEIEAENEDFALEKAKEQFWANPWVHTHIECEVMDDE